MSRLLKGYCTEYLSASQVQQVRVRRFQTRTLVVNFNGAIPKEETVTSVRWDCTSPWATYIRDAAVAADGKSSGLKVDFNFAGWGAIKATAEVSDGSVLNYEFQITVKDAPIYPAAVYSTANGPYYLIATA